MRLFAGVCAAALVAMGAQGAGAAQLFFDDFAGEPVPMGGALLNYDSFANFIVGDEGTVDIIADGAFGLQGTDNFVDLDGSSGSGSFIETRQSFDFTGGQLVTLSFLAGGNQRQGIDGLFGGFRFVGSTPPAIGGVTISPSFFNTQQPAGLLLGVDPFVFSTDPYQEYSISFRSFSSGSFTALIGTDSNDNIGPLVDNVRISAAAIPEPATWAMLILGFGAVGAAIRSRRRMAATAATR